MRRIKDLVIHEISILFDGPPAVSDAKVLIAKSSGADTEWTPEIRAGFLAVIDAIETELEKARVEYGFKKRTLEGLMRGASVRKGDADENLRAGLARFTSAFEQAMRSLDVPTVPVPTLKLQGADGPDYGTHQAELKAAQDDNQSLCTEENAELMRRRARNRTI